jgi:hypothetical protein
MVNVKCLHEIKMTVLTKIAVALDTNKKHASETMLCSISDDIVLAYYNSSDTLLKMSDSKIIAV